MLIQQSPYQGLTTISFSFDIHELLSQLMHTSTYLKEQPTEHYNIWVLRNS